jgi:hypothetical protein
MLIPLTAVSVMLHRLRTAVAGTYTSEGHAHMFRLQRSSRIQTRQSISIELLPSFWAKEVLLARIV